MMRPSAELLLIALATNAIAWAAYRLDKACARRGWRRISEGTLLFLTLFGGLGALAGMYAHRQRHKTHKPRFLVAVVVATLLQLGALAGLGYLLVAARGA
jgi:uncharacterized membrane protein YsdA (DUF1294 family)